SKATIDIISEHSGTLRHAVATGEESQAGRVICDILVTDEEVNALPRVPRQKAETGGRNLIITVGAQELIDLHRVDVARLGLLGRKVIRRSDVESLIGDGGKPGPRRTALSRRQRAVAKVVSLSHTTIPKAFLVIKIYCDEAIVAATQYSEREATTVG